MEGGGAKMVIEVKIRNKEERRSFSNTIRPDSTGKLKPFRVYGDGGEPIDIHVRSDNPRHFKCFIKRSDGKDVCFEFKQLEIGEERILFVGTDRETGKLISSPYRVIVEKIPG